MFFCHFEDALDSRDVASWSSEDIKLRDRSFVKDNVQELRQKSDTVSLLFYFESVFVCFFIWIHFTIISELFPTPSIPIYSIDLSIWGQEIITYKKTYLLDLN